MRLNTKFIALLLLIAPFILNSQEAISDMYRNYNVEVGLVGDSVTFEYEVFFESSDDSSKSVYRTSSLDTFIYLLEEDLKVLPVNKRDILFYLHGMMGGQRMNFRMTKTDLRERYIGPETSDLGRIISFRWPGNKPAYQADKVNVYLVAEEMSLVTQTIISSLQKSNLNSENIIDFDMLSHSLGCELFKEMVFYLEEDKKYFDQVLLCAPDLDVDVFVKDGPLFDLYKYANRVTIYHSNKDLTLGFSKKLNDKGRLGIDGPDSESHFHTSYVYVDMTLVNDEKFLPMRFTGHAYYRGSDLAGSDMLATLIGTPAESIELRVPKEAKGSRFSIVPPVE